MSSIFYKKHILFVFLLIFLSLSAYAELESISPPLSDGHTVKDNGSGVDNDGFDGSAFFDLTVDVEPGVIVNNNFGDAIKVGFFSSVTNQFGGTITAGWIGITGDVNNTIENCGLINADNDETGSLNPDVYVSGIRAVDDNTIINGVDAVINAGKYSEFDLPTLPYFPSYGISVEENNHITNSGTINAYDSAIKADNLNEIRNEGILNSYFGGINVLNDNQISNMQGAEINVGFNGICARDNNFITNNGNINAHQYIVVDLGDNNTLINNGLISSANETISAYGHLNLVNETDGEIFSNIFLEHEGEGISANMHAGDVENSGLISGSVVIRDYGRIKNNITGIISAKDSAVHFKRVGVLENEGAITANENYGVYIQGDGSVNNHIDGEIIAGGEYGVRIDGHGDVHNEGTISAVQAYGVSLGSGGTVTNNGLISSEYTGVMVEGIGEINNDGTISSAMGNGVFLGQGVLNNSGIISSNECGVLLEQGILRNNGTVLGDYTGVKAGNSGDSEIINSGTISTVGGYAIDSYYPNRVLTITNSGIIAGSIGSIRTGNQNDYLTLQTGSQLNGIVDLGDGNDSLTLEGHGAEDDKFVNIETLNVNADSDPQGWTLSHDSLNFNIVNINSGIFNVADNFNFTEMVLNNGTVSGDINLESGDTLKGSGTINGIVSGDIKIEDDSVFQGEVTFKGNVVNHGQINAKQEAVKLVHDNSLINQAGAIIESAKVGISSTEDNPYQNNTITNYGEIKSKFIGISATDTQITNFGTITAYNNFQNGIPPYWHYTSTIEIGDDNTIVNEVSGVINAGNYDLSQPKGALPATAIGRYSYFGNMDLEGNNNVIINKGAINSGGFGILAGDNNEIQNHGFINSASTSIGVEDNNSIVNALSAIINTEDIGIRAGTNNHIINRGNINSLDNHAMLLVNNNTVDNSGILSSSGVTFKSEGQVSLFNEGEIIGRDYAVEINNVNNYPFESVVENSGIISADANCGIYASEDTGSLNILNKGTISGATASIVTGNQNDSLTLQTGSQLNGMVDLGDGNDSLTLEGHGAEDDNFINIETLNVNGDTDPQGWALLHEGLNFNSVNINSGILNVADNFNFTEMVLNNGTVSGNINLESGDTLRGSGTINGNVVNDGVISPGFSPGEIEILGDYTQTGVLDIEIWGSEVGEFDQFTVHGNMFLGGVLNLIIADDAIFNAGDVFRFLFADNISGSFEDILFPNFLGGDDLFNLDFSSSSEWSLIATRDFDPSGTNEVPEPASIFLLLSSILGFGFYRKKRVNI